MIAYPVIDPVAFAVGPVKVHWYGLMYVVGFVAGWWLGRRRAAAPGSTWKPNDVDDFMFFALSTRMIPAAAVLVFYHVMFAKLGLTDTLTGLVIVVTFINLGLATWIMKAFIDQIPAELEEAAIVDGATLGQTLWRVVIPLAVHGLVAACVFVLVFSWNEFVFALIFTTREAKTTPLVISEMLGSVEGVDWGTLFAASTVQLVPIVVFVLAAQRYLMAGLSAGAVKG